MQLLDMSNRKVMPTRAVLSGLARELELSTSSGRRTDIEDREMANESLHRIRFKSRRTTGSEFPRGCSRPTLASWRAHQRAYWLAPSEDHPTVVEASHVVCVTSGRWTFTLPLDRIEGRHLTIRTDCVICCAGDIECLV
jgi:hypothetical protein